MLKNYLKSVWRSVQHSKSFSIINVTGLAIGMASALLIFIWIRYEISYDRFHQHRDRLYEVYGLTTVDQQLSVINLSEQPLAPALQKDFPEVENTARVTSINNFLITAGDKRFTGIKGYFVDPSFLELFDFPVTMGKNLFRNINSIVITAKFSKQLFGDQNPLNKLVRINADEYCIVTGVLKDPPSNSRFDFNYLLSWNYLKKLEGTSDSWLTNNISTFVLLKPHTNVSLFNSKIENIARTYSGRNDIWTHFLFPLKQWHLYTTFEKGKPSGGRIEMLWLFGIIAILLLFIACINFMNLSTARSQKRAKEIGVRKAVGAGKVELITQFLMEAILTAAIAGILALLLLQLILPYFNVLINTQLQIPYSSVHFWLYIIGFMLLTGLLAGSYPAFYLSAFKPVNILKARFKTPETKLSPRKVMVVLQFTIAIALITSTIIIKNQIDYTQNRPNGYTPGHLIYVNLTGDIGKNYLVIKQELLSTGIATSVTKTMAPITERGSNTWGLTWENKPSDFDETIALSSADANLVKTAGLQLLAGRDLNIENYPSDSFAVLLNETAAKTMGFNSPIGQILREKSAQRNWHVVGVVKDYVIGSPYSKVPPMVIEGAASSFNAMHIRISTNASIENNLIKAAGIFKKYNQDYPFDYQFIDEEYAAKFLGEQRIKTLAGLFSSVAIFISCLGLLGLSAYMAESRVKEIGIRKVLGASVLHITRLLTFDFIKLVAIAIIIATPLAWWIMTTWLNNFAYRSTISWHVFAISGFIAILIASFTLSFEVIRAAITSPVRSLRTE